MPKILGLITTLLLFIVTTTPVSAATCNFTVSPNPPSQDSDPLTINVSSNEISSGTYQLDVYSPGTLQLSKKDISFTTGQTSSVTFSKPSTRWPAGSYKVVLNVQGQIKTDGVCNGTFDVPLTNTQASCETSITNRNIDPDTNVELKVTGLSPDNRNIVGLGGYDLWITGTGGYKNNLIYSTNDGSTVSLGKFNVGTYRVEIKNRGGFSSTNLQCPVVSFAVAPKGQTGGGQITSPGSGTGSVGANNVPKTTSAGIQCDSRSGQPVELNDQGKPVSENQQADGIFTAIGCIPADPATLINSLLRYASGAGGGIALVLMIWGAIEMVLSNGDPARVKAGQDRFTSAIIGLVFILFSVVLLKIIGIDILGLNRLGAPFS